MEATPIPFDLRIAELRQRSEESLAAYYKRVTNMLRRVDLRPFVEHSPCLQKASPSYFVFINLFFPRRPFLCSVLRLRLHPPLLSRDLGTLIWDKRI